MKVLSKLIAIQWHLQSPLLILFFLVFPHLYLLLPLKSWTPQSHPWALESASSKLGSVDILTSSYGSGTLFMASRMVNSFQKVFKLLCPDPSKESLSSTVIALQNGWNWSPLHRVKQARKINTNTVYQHIYMEFRKMITITLYARQKKRHRCIEQTFGLYGRRRGWDDLRE